MRGMGKNIPPFLGKGHGVAVDGASRAAVGEVLLAAPVPVGVIDLHARHTFCGQRLQLRGQAGLVQLVARPPIKGDLTERAVR